MSFCDEIRSMLPELRACDAARMAPLTLAYIGDTVYDLYVRTLLLHRCDATVHNLHLKAAGMVRASAQAQASSRLQPLFTDEEAAVYRRGRNAHMGTVPRNASIADYRAATGLEAVLGFLFLSGEDTRIRELMTTALLHTEGA